MTSSEIIQAHAEQIITREEARVLLSVTTIDVEAVRLLNELFDNRKPESVKFALGKGMPDDDKMMADLVDLAFRLSESLRPID